MRILLRYFLFAFLIAPIGGVVSAILCAGVLFGSIDLGQRYGIPFGVAGGLAVGLLTGIIPALGHMRLFIFCCFGCVTACMLPFAMLGLAPFMLPLFVITYPIGMLIYWVAWRILRSERSTA